MKQILPILLAAVLLLGILAACGSPSQGEIRQDPAAAIAELTA